MSATRKWSCCNRPHRSTTEWRKRQCTECRRKDNHYQDDRKDKATQTISKHEPNGSADRLYADSTAPGEAVDQSPRALSPQEFARRYQEDRIAQLEADILSLALSAKQSTKSMRTIENKNAELCRSIRNLQLTNKSEQQQHTERLKSAEAAFPHKMIRDKASNENKWPEKAKNVNTEIAGLQKRLNEKTENVLRQIKLAKEYRAYGLGVCQRMRDELTGNERQKEEDLKNAKIEKLKLLKKLKAALVKNASLMEKIDKQRENT